ncbi:hypothetical protein RAJCM14343_1490 [Rhodococcus aetherivorans]|uniref:IPT/TIG domain-containing protein n=1 Tax=Rhodococcus aetherivorans TaxID=191292 RepID=A0ABQ0YIC3_9NOCA|nr:IPT/TIG domain-containing protein [Rhodococcus aetherivorans]ETT24116.1 cell surface receptor IPT/TIG domain protein [Rhodococcus rhodochrous ATCC 21198]NGP26671.1 hypothetical protein [Rhodococcus aetherivorans]GES36239.1 hypothetical protein RAJCM14343_1490 [Rhodococcus aetherivorans]
MEQLALDTAFATRGIPHVAFWNGRVLTAEDLRAEQVANLLGRNRIGRAVGAGMVRGFAVSPGSSPTHVMVSAGLAVDPSGQMIELPVDVDLSLVVPAETAGGDGVFTVCDPVTSNTPTGTGLYLLAARPASQSQSLAVGVEALGSGVATECGPKYTVDGVSFRLIGIDATALATQAGHDPADVDDLGALGGATQSPLARNVLAHLFLDTVPWSQRFADPFGDPTGQVELGTLAALRAGALRPCEVPIALITWSFDGVGFIDTWAVRRPPSTEPAYTAIQSLGTARRQLLGRASFAQFQDHLDTIRSELGPAARQAFELADAFRYLPAAGLIPIARTGRSGFADTVFGDAIVRGPVPIAPTRVGAILDESFRHTAIDLASGEVIFVYTVAAGSGAVDHLVFCTSRMEFLGDELVIDAVFPGGTLFIGQQIEIRGRGFGFTTGDARVRFDDRAANPLPGSSDTRLLVTVPLTLTVDPTGTAMTLEVSSNIGTDSVPVVVGHPEQSPVGQLHVEWVSVEPTTLEIGLPATLTYRIRSAVTPAVDVVLTQSATDFAQLVDEAGTAITGPIRMNTGDEKTVRLQIEKVPQVATLTISLAAAVGGITGSNTRQFTIGMPTPPRDPAITILSPDFDPQPGPAATFDGTTIRMAHQATANLEFVLEVTQPGSYEVRVEPSSLSPPWPSVLSAPSTGVFPSIQVSEIGGDGVATREIRVTVGRDSSGAPPPATVTLIVNRPGRADDARVSFQLAGL